MCLWRFGVVSGSLAASVPVFMESRKFGSSSLVSCSTIAGSVCVFKCESRNETPSAQPSRTRMQ